jgi:CRP-like cAMP-binding protein
MRNVSNEWLAAISTGRDYSIDEKKRGCAVPVTPWLHPPVGKRLRDLITKLGTVRELDRQEILYPQGRKISDIVLVQQGVTARNFGNAVSGPKAAAISTPGHFACGNLNFLTRRPSLGSYFALTKAQVVVCPKDLLLPVLTTDPELFAYTIRLLESCTLSDRVGFALMAFAPVDLRLKAFVVTWAIHYCRRLDQMPYSSDTEQPLSRRQRLSCVHRQCVKTMERRRSLDPGRRLRHVPCRLRR